uniref:Uncharacterized protein n=1 Tax=Amphiprion percula TaxID=161767 RepID=A0A3P8RHN6_AMPPE
MLGSVLLCCWSFSLLRLSSSLVHGNIQLDEAPAAGRRPDTSYLSDMERGHAPDPALLPEDSVEDHFLLDGGSYDEMRLQRCSCRVVPCVLLGAAFLTSSPVWDTRCPAVTPVTPATAASSMPSATAAESDTPVPPDAPEYSTEDSPEDSPDTRNSDAADGNMSMMFNCLNLK